MACCVLACLPALLLPQSAHQAYTQETLESSLQRTNKLPSVDTFTLEVREVFQVKSNIVWCLPEYLAELFESIFQQRQKVFRRLYNSVALSCAQPLRRLLQLKMSPVS